MQLLPGQPAQPTTRAKEFQASDGGGEWCHAEFDVLDVFLEKYLAPASTPGTELDGAWTLVNLWVVGALSGASEEVNTPRYEEFDADTWKIYTITCRYCVDWVWSTKENATRCPKWCLLSTAYDTNDGHDDLY